MDIINKGINLNTKILKNLIISISTFLLISCGTSESKVTEEPKINKEVNKPEIAKPIDKIKIEKTYYNTGELEWERGYRNGTQDGLTKGYYKNGTLKSKAKFTDGKMNGLVILYNKTLKILFSRILNILGPTRFPHITTF